MMHLFQAFIFILSISAFANTKMKYEKRNLISKKDQKYLAAIPEGNLANLRWYGKRNYSSHHGYTYKGKAIEVREGTTHLGYIFEDKELTKNTGLTFSSTGIFHWGKPECLSGGARFACDSEKTLFCFFSYCAREKELPNLQKGKCYKPTLDFHTNDTGKGCPYKVDVVEAYRSPDEEARYLLRFISIDEKKKTAELSVNDKVMYVDIRKCFDRKDLCSIVDYKHSHYELDWIKLQKVKENKSDEILNYFIKNLLPCVEKKNRKCIASFFISSTDDKDAKTENWGGNKVTVSDEEVEELRYCLRYDSILPHGYAFRGKNKACIINRYFMTNELGPGRGADTTKLIAIEYPESLSTDDEYNSYYSPQRGVYRALVDLNDYPNNGTKNE